MTKVLIVDDEKSIRETLGEFLLKENYDVLLAPDAIAALNILSHEIDIIVTDLIMPQISGIEFVEQIRKKNTSVQILIMTGEPTTETAIKALKYGANDYLTKPISRHEFLKSVKNSALIKQLQDKKEQLEIQNLQYQKNLEAMVIKRTASLQRAMRGIVVLLATVVEVRDPYTAGHQRRVGNLSAAIAKKMGLSYDNIEYLRIIGYIHDIGKIVVPGEILSKPGPLSYPETEMIKSHAQMGYEMLLKVDLPPFIGVAISQHHERCDGSGYPYGLKDVQILEEAKIIAVADVVEAMMSHRPYRPALGLDAALHEIRYQGGIRFDRNVVEACTRIFEHDNYLINDQAYTVSFPIEDI